MTEDYKKNLMDLFCGRALDSDFDGINEENQLSSSEYDYSSILPANASNIGIYGVLEVPETLGNKSVLYGEYELDSEWYGMVILIDENQNPEECITEFDSGTKLRPIQKMIMDASGNVYAVDSTMPGFINGLGQSGIDYSNAILRFIMLNNFVLKTNGAYEVRLRASYIITNQVAVTGLTFFCRDMFKDPVSANYILVGSNVDTNGNPVCISLKVNVGSSNEWELYTESDQTVTTIFLASNVDWNSSEADLLILVEDLFEQKIKKYSFNNESNYFTEEIMASQTNSASSFPRVFMAYKFFSNNLGYFTFVDYDIDVEAFVYYWKYENNSISLFYEERFDAIEFEFNDSVYWRFPVQIYIVGNINNLKFLKYVFRENEDSIVDVYKGSINNSVFSYENIPFSSLELPVEPSPTLFYESWKIFWLFATKKTNFNLNYYYLFPACLPVTSDGKYTVVKNLYDPNGYSGSFPTYDIEDTYKDSLVPSQAISSHIQGEETIVDFARNIYNVQIDGNITTSSVEIPYNYLNENSNQLALFSETNLQMNNDYSMVKNRYEIVDANFVNAISIINNNDNAGIYNQVGASRLNSAVTNGADYTYYIDKFLINYSDETYKLNQLQVVEDDDTHSHIMFSFLVDKEINNIELVDNSTSVIDGVLQKGIVYQTIDGSSMQVGKLYAINQPVHIE